MSEEVKITNAYFEGAGKIDVKPLLEKQFSTAVSYKLAILFKKLSELAPIYFQEKQKIYNRFSAKYEQDGEEIKEDKVIRKWKVGDIIINTNNVGETTIIITDPVTFSEEMNILLSVEVPIEMKKIKIDFVKELCNLSVNEMMVILPFIEEIKED